MNSKTKSRRGQSNHASKNQTSAFRKTLMASTVVAATVVINGCAADQSSIDLATALAPGNANSGIETGSITNAALPTADDPSASAHAKAPKKNNLLTEVSRLRAMKRAPEALALLEDASKSQTATPEMRLSHGLLALEVGKLADAKKILKTAEKNDPPNWRVLSGLGSVYAAEGDQPKAQKAFARALRLKPDHPSILNNLALSYALDGKRDRAEAILRRAAADTTANPQAKQNLALLLGLEGRKSEASKFAEAVLPKTKADANLGYLAELRSTVKVSKDERSKPKVRSAAKN